MKARDLRGKNIEDLEDDASEPKEEEDAVTAAYENISKKLESIRNTKDEEGDSEESDKDSDEVELEEWKGPRKPAKEELNPEEDEDIKNLDDESPKKKDQDEEDDGDEIDPLEDEDEEEEEKEDEESADSDEEDSEPVKEKWQPKENDPLDEDDESAVSEPRSGKDDEEEEETERVHSEIRASEPSDMPEDRTRDMDGDERPVHREPEPDTLDDLAEESPMKKSQEEDDEYFIPNLKGSRQNEGEVGYNTHPQRSGVGESYSPRGNYMEGNDPNNFFSQHSQPQPPKRANKFHLLVLVLIGIGVIGFTVYILKGGFGNINLGTPEASPSPSPVATTEPTPTPTPEPEIERGNFTVRVLNGTDTSGLAKTVSDKLKEDGYKTSTPGNAPDSDVAQTQIKVKEGTESAALLQRLTLDLAPDYEAVAGDELDEDAKYDAEVIIGDK